MVKNEKYIKQTHPRPSVDLLPPPPHHPQRIYHKLKWMLTFASFARRNCCNTLLRVSYKATMCCRKHSESPSLVGPYEKCQQRRVMLFDSASKCQRLTSATIIRRKINSSPRHTLYEQSSLNLIRLQVPIKNVGQNKQRTSRTRARLWISKNFWSEKVVIGALRPPYC